MMEYSDWKFYMDIVEDIYRKAQISEWKARGTDRWEAAEGKLAWAWIAVRSMDSIEVEWPRGEPLTPYEEKLLQRGVARMRAKTEARFLQRKYDDVARH